MKCITIQQPWATLLVTGEKQFETRSWRTGYTGPVAIHAGRTCGDIMRLCREEPLRSALARHGIASWEDLPLGAILGVVDLAACHPTETLTPTPTELAFENAARTCGVGPGVSNQAENAGRAVGFSAGKPLRTSHDLSNPEETTCRESTRGSGRLAPGLTSHPSDLSSLPRHPPIPTLTFAPRGRGGFAFKAIISFPYAIASEQHRRWLLDGETSHG
jgi:hypothetical protein